MKDQEGYTSNIILNKKLIYKNYNTNKGIVFLIKQSSFE